jgi:ABC-type multidrug transport system ATPase subunit
MISLRVDNITKKYNRHIIFDKLSFEHENGILGISGPNGSGKSTLLKCLAFLVRPNSGSVIWQINGEDLSQDALKAHIGFAAPYINLYSELSVSENLYFLMEARGEKADPDKIEELITQFQILDFKDKLYGNLSTGQQQRVKLASALIRDPKILMLDEPGSNLDEKGRELVSSIIQEASDAGKMIFLASNDPNEIALCDVVLNLDE